MWFPGSAVRITNSIKPSVWIFSLTSPQKHRVLAGDDLGSISGLTAALKENSGHIDLVSYDSV